MMQRKIISKTRRCGECNFTELVGSLHDTMCLGCGHKTNIKSKDRHEIGLKEAPERYPNKKSHDEILFELKDEVTNCPRCEGTNLAISKQFFRCKSCKFVGKREWR